MQDYREHLDLTNARARELRPRDPDTEADELEALLSGAEPGVENEAVQLLKHSPLTRNEEYTRLRLAVLDRKREVLLRLRNEGVVDDTITRQITTRLDIEEIRLTGIGPLD